MAVEDKSRAAHSIPDAAKRCSVSVAFLYNEIAEKRLKAKKIGRRTVVLDGDLTAWLEARPAAFIKPREKREKAAA
jgi:hypothetical protein